MIEFIENFKKQHGEHFFLNGGCYIFARILQVRYGGVIYSNIDHCVLQKDNMYYDITGELNPRLNKGYIIIDELEEARYKKYQNFM